MVLFLCKEYVSSRMRKMGALNKTKPERRLKEGWKKGDAFIGKKAKAYSKEKAGKG